MTNQSIGGIRISQRKEYSMHESQIPKQQQHANRLLWTCDNKKTDENSIAQGNPHETNNW